MKIPKHVEEEYKCDTCKKSLLGTWYRLAILSNVDFCSVECGTKYRDIVYKVVPYDPYPRLIGNTD